jgi:hypothetical protein
LQGNKVEYSIGQVENIAENGSDISSMKYFLPVYQLPFQYITAAQKNTLVEAARYQYVLFNRESYDPYTMKLGKITGIDVTSRKGETYEVHDVNLSIKELP